jgi:hypothetical protein
VNRPVRTALLNVLERRQTESAARNAYAAMVAELAALGPAQKAAEDATNAGYHAALMAAATPAKGKSPKDVEAAWKKLSEEQRAKIKAEWHPRADDVWREFKGRRESLEADLRDLAPYVPLRAGPGTWEIVSYSSSTYRSTSWGADYARAQAAIAAAGMKNRGVEIAVEPFWYDEAKRSGDGPDGFKVIALCEGAVDAEVLKRLPGVPLREWVRLCWKLGANPRVYSPYLPHGYEEREGLDFFGGDKHAGAKS